MNGQKIQTLRLTDTQMLLLKIQSQQNYFAQIAIWTVKVNTCCPQKHLVYQSEKIFSFVRQPRRLDKMLIMPRQNKDFQHGAWNIENFAHGAWHLNNFEHRAWSITYRWYKKPIRKLWLQWYALRRLFRQSKLDFAVDTQQSWMQQMP